MREVHVLNVMRFFGVGMRQVRKDTSRSDSVGGRPAKVSRKQRKMLLGLDMQSQQKQSLQTLRSRHVREKKSIRG